MEIDLLGKESDSLIAVLEKRFWRLSDHREQQDYNTLNLCTFEIA